MGQEIRYIPYMTEKALSNKLQKGKKIILSNYTQHSTEEISNLSPLSLSHAHQKKNNDVLLCIEELICDSIIHF